MSRNGSPPALPRDPWPRSAARLLAAVPAVLLAAVPISGAVHGDDPPPTARVTRAAEWELERIELRDKKMLEGLILAERGEKVELVHIIRRPGKPMIAVRRRIPRDQIQRIERLPSAARRKLLERYRAFRQRTRIELGRMEDLKLTHEQSGSAELWRYAGEGFALRSTADEEMTRRCIVRIEQMFAAYRQLLPPRVETAAGFEVRLFGSMDDYHGYLQRHGLDLANPAFYSAAQNLIVAGSDLSRYSQRLTQIRRDNEATVRNYEKVLNPRFDRELARLSTRLRSQRLNLDEIDLRRAAWDRQYQAVLRRVKETNRRNEAKFAEVTRQMFTRLYHEAFHAYLDNHVYPHRRNSVPGWLNEGLAQVFESGRLEADTLRIDAPPTDRLRRLKADLRGAAPLRLAAVLQADGQSFLVKHQAASAERQYLYAWALAYHLTFAHDLLASKTMDAYVSTEAARLPAITRFERLVGMPLDEFENAWRQAMLAL